MWPTVLLRASLIAAIAAIGTRGPVAQEAAEPTQSDPIGTLLQSSDWTVVAMAPDGTLGVATAATSGQAIAQAIRSCRTISRQRMGCGSQSGAVRGGWILALRCGSSNIIATERLLADAERMAADREAQLRHLYVPNLPPCRRVLTVDPQGGIGVTGS
jgi:hypothetical protein